MTSREIQRREMLAALLGMPALLAGCGSESPVIPTIGALPGELIGPSVEVGHRIRDGIGPSGNSVTPSADAWEETDTVIVGGGAAGLSAAWRLLRGGPRKFVILDVEKTAGGTSRSGKQPASVSSASAYPWGAHYIPAPTRDNPALVALLDEMGILEGADAAGQPLVAEQHLCRDPQERVFYRGHWHEGLYLHAGATPADLAEYGRFQNEIDRWVARRDGAGRQAFAIPVAHASDDPEIWALDKMSMADWLDQRKLTSPRLRWLVDYACRDDYGLKAEQASAWAGVFYFASRVERRGADARPLITWPAGNGRLIEHLAGGLTDRLRLGLAAVDIIPTTRDDRSGVDVIAITAASAGSGSPVAHGFHARRVIFAAPQFLAKYLIRPFRDEPPKYLSDFQYGSWMVANLFLRGRPAERGFPLCWDNVLYDSPSLGYVTATHQTGPDYGPTVLTYYYPLCDSDPRLAREKLLQMDWRACAELALTDLSRAHPDLPNLVERIDVMRWGHAMIRPTPGFVSGPSRAAATKPFRGIHFANTDLSGVALFEEAFHHGLRAAEEVLATNSVIATMTATRIGSPQIST